MIVPEAAMHEYDFLSTREHKVGRTRQVSPMKPVPVAHAVHEAANEEFRLGVLGADATHQVAAFFRCERVNHEPSGGSYISPVECADEPTARMDISPPLKRFSPWSV